MVKIKEIPGALVEKPNSCFCAYTRTKECRTCSAITQQGEVEITLNREKLANILWYRYSKAERGSFYNDFSTISEEKRHYWLGESDAILADLKELLEVVK